jgi:hypothetical protein
VSTIWKKKDGITRDGTTIPESFERACEFGASRVMRTAIRHPVKAGVGGNSKLTVDFKVCNLDNVIF